MRQSHIENAAKLLKACYHLADTGSMNEQRKALSERLLRGASMHRIAARVIEQKRGTSTMWKLHAAAYLALVVMISIGDAKAIIAEMSVDN